jgi:hypothetical protein
VKALSQAVASGPVLTHAGVTEIILTKNTWPKSVDMVITYRKLHYKTAHGRYLRTHHMGDVERWHGIKSKPRGQLSAIAPPSTPICTDMDVREPFSRLKKKIKHRLTGSKHKSDRTEADAGGERADASGLLSRLESHVVTGGGHPDVEGVVGSGPSREGNDAGEDKVEQVDPSPSTPSLAHDGKPDGM